MGPKEYAYIMNPHTKILSLLAAGCLLEKLKKLVKDITLLYLTLK